MQIAGRSLDLVLRTATDPVHVRGLAAAPAAYEDPARALLRYATARGGYPWTARVRAAGERLAIPCRSWHDLVTVHEVFARGDYAVSGAPHPRTMLDLGANIGVVSAWVLACDPAAEVHCVEPVPANLDLMARVLAPFPGRWTLDAVAVGTEAGTADFGVEPTGRYGGLGVATGETMPVTVRAIGDIVDEQLERWGVVDLLKMDVEGAELDLLRALGPAQLERIGSIAVEHEHDLPADAVPAGFTVHRHLDVHHIVRTVPPRAARPAA